MEVNIISGLRLIVMTQDLFFAKPTSSSLDAVFLKITTPLFQVRLKLTPTVAELSIAYAGEWSM